eukprot:evm.model.scf_1854.1 EVM.evm.TU.scf_1854.1   scf_1854:1451-1936(+)
MPSLRQPASQRPMRILGRSGWRRDPPGPPGADWPGPAGPKEGPRGPIASAGTSDGEPRSPRGPAGSTQSTPRSSPRTDRSGGAGAERWRLGPIPEGGEGGWGKERPPVGWRAKYRLEVLQARWGGEKGGPCGVKAARGLLENDLDLKVGKLQVVQRAVLMG